MRSADSISHGTSNSTQSGRAETTSIAPESTLAESALFTISSSTFGWKGLARYRYTCSFTALKSVSGVLSAVITITLGRGDGSLRNCARNSNPFMRGIQTSSNIKSYFFFLNFSKPSRPSLALSVEYPAVFINSQRSRRMARSSSTTRILLISSSSIQLNCKWDCPCCLQLMAGIGSSKGFQLSPESCCLFLECGKSLLNADQVTLPRQSFKLHGGSQRQRSGKNTDRAPKD